MVAKIAPKGAKRGDITATGDFCGADSTAGAPSMSAAADYFVKCASELDDPSVATVVELLPFLTHTLTKTRLPIADAMSYILHCLDTQTESHLKRFAQRLWAMQGMFKSRDLPSGLPKTLAPGAHPLNASGSDRELTVLPDPDECEGREGDNFVRYVHRCCRMMLGLLNFKSPQPRQPTEDRNWRREFDKKVSMAKGSGAKA